VVLVCLLADLGFAALGYSILDRGLHFDPTPVRGSGDCGWSITGPAEPELGEGPDLCLQSIAGVSLTRASLVREPSYLDDATEYGRWRADQRALWSALADAEQASVVATGERGALRSWQAPVLGFSWSSGSWRMAPTIFTALAPLLIGSLVLLRRPRRLAARALFILRQAIWVCALASAVKGLAGSVSPPLAAAVFNQLNLLGFVTGVLALTFLAATFPEPIAGQRTVPVAAIGLVVFGALAWGLELAGVFGASLVLVGPVAAVALGLIAYAQLRPMAQVRRLEARWLLWGLAVPAITLLVTRVPLMLGLGTGADPTDELILLSCLAVPAGIAVAVLRHRLLDIEVVVRRTILGAAVTLVVLFLYNLGISIFARGLAGSSAEQPWYHAVFICALVLSFVLLPAQARLESLLDRSFFRNRFHYRRVLARVPDQLAAIDSSEEAAWFVIDRVGEAMQPARLVVSLMPQQGPGRWWLRCHPPGSVEEREVLRPPADDDFWEALRQLQRPHLCEPGADAGPLDVWMQQAGLDLALPLRTPEALVGLLACSGPPGRGLLAGEDVEALGSVAASLALSLSHALAYETIRRLNLELEERVRQRTAELERARLQLYQ